MTALEVAVWLVDWIVEGMLLWSIAKHPPNILKRVEHDPNTPSVR